MSILSHSPEIQEAISEGVKCHRQKVALYKVLTKCLRTVPVSTLRWWCDEFLYSYRISCLADFQSDAQIDSSDDDLPF